MPVIAMLGWLVAEREELVTFRIARPEAEVGRVRTEASGVGLRSSSTAPQPGLFASDLATVHR